MSSAQSQSAPQPNESTTSVLPEDMDLEEVMRVMDVASTLRREQEIVERVFKLGDRVLGRHRPQGAVIEPRFSYGLGVPGLGPR